MQPTDEMIEAGRMALVDATGHGYGPELVRAVYDAMRGAETPVAIPGSQPANSTAPAKEMTMGTVEDVVIGCLRGIIPPEKHDPWAEKLLAKAIATALREAGLVREWEPIETAPKDGLPLIGCGDGVRFMMKWLGNASTIATSVQAAFGGPTHADLYEAGWYAYGFASVAFDRSAERVLVEPTHWIPLPPLPEGTEK